MEVICSNEMEIKRKPKRVTLRKTQKKVYISKTRGLMLTREKHTCHVGRIKWGFAAMTESNSSAPAADLQTRQRGRGLADDGGHTPFCHVGIISLYGVPYLGRHICELVKIGRTLINMGICPQPTASGEPGDHTSPPRLSLPRRHCSSTAVKVGETSSS